MSYSKDTLEKAIKLLKNAKPDLKNKGLPTSHLESYLHQLRDKPQRPVGGCTAPWIDEDESGDYTPTTESSQKPKRATQVSENSSNGGSTPKKAGNKRSLQREKSGEGYLVTLKLNTPKGKEFLANLSKDNLPSHGLVGKEDSSDFSTAWPVLSQSRKKTPNKFASARPTLSGRRSGRISSMNQKGARGQKGYRGTRSLLSLVPGDPETRGCKSCWENYHHCSLLKEPAAYPCQVCRDNRSDCDLIIEPKQKRPCEACKRNGLTCSYGETTMFDRPCEQCGNSRTECIAGPADFQTSGQIPANDQNPFSFSERKGTEKPKSSLLQRFQASGNRHTTPEHASSSLASQSAGTSSSGTIVGDQTPMTSESPVELRDRNSARDTPSPSIRIRPTQSVHPTIKPNAKPRGTTSSSVSGPSLVGHIAGFSRGGSGNLAPSLTRGRVTKQSYSATKGPRRMDVGRSSVGGKQVTKEDRRVGGKSIIIRTPFAHPINFSHVPPRNGSKPCHWCHDFTYGISGLGNLDVEVVKKPDGAGYIEIRGGHVGQGKEQSRMCSICALERIYIDHCRRHTIIALKELDEDTFDFEKAFRSLKPDDKTGRCVQTNPWCSLCPNPAFFGCGTPQKFNMFREPLDSESEGCGLLLCSDCAQVMDKCDSDIARTVQEHKKMGRELRADAEFLLPKNDLFKAY